MAEISLRAYVKELDDLIEREQLDEAIAHCRHILQTYPKHLDVYRLLGKAYLEAKRYGDAADIFQRVLSAVPDDFVAHIGMAIVREDEGNLDAAIWHMERAFETTPSNAAIQQELRRLIGRRDGLEPHKVRLTRGALARMYAHGELYAQAIAELRSALQEETDRPDLQVLLAEMYWRLGQRTEAAEVCQKILESLPFCREANRIMAAILQASGQAEEAVTYHRRLASLEPYAALVETAMDDPSRVDANAVRLEKLAWVAGQPVRGTEAGQPEWAASLGVDMRNESARPSPAKRPSWLESLESETAGAKKPEVPPSPAPALESTPAAEPVPPPAMPAEPQREIPDWMRSAGWREGTGKVVEAPVSFSDSELASLEAGTLPPAEGELAPADIPDWLKDIAPAEGLPEPEVVPQPPAATADADWLGAGAQVSADEGAPRLPPGWSSPAPSPAETPRAAERVPSGPAVPPPAVPTWMEEAAPGATETIVTWLGDRSREALGRGARPEVPPPTEEPTLEPAPQTEGDIFKETLPEGVPDWLADEVSWGTASEPAPSQAPKEPEPEGPAWLSGVAAAAAEGESLKPEELPWRTSEPAPEAPAQLGMYAEEPAAPSGSSGAVPDWIKAIADSDFAAEAPPSDEAPEGPPAEQPDWLREGGSFQAGAESRAPLDWSDEAEEPSAAPTPFGASLASQEEKDSDVPKESLAWLRELAEAEPPSPPSKPDEVEEPGAPGWLRGIGEDRSARSALGRASSPEWLRGIAEPEPEPASQLSEEGTLDWMRGIAEGEPATPAPTALAAPTEPARPEAAAESGLEWVSFAGTDQPPSPTSTGEWLKRLKAEGVPSEPSPPTPPPLSPPPQAASEEALDDEQVFQWLESLAARQGAEETQPSEPAEAGIPEPLAAVGVPTIEPARVPPEEPADGLEWLEKLAAERGLETQESRAGITPAPPPTTPPPPPAAAPAPEVPDWLKELVAESGQPPAEPPEPSPVAPPVPMPTAPIAETLPVLPDWMLASPTEETEPAIPLPQALAPVEETEIEEPAPAEETPLAVPAGPIEELAEGWVPPWESLELEPEPPAPPRTPEPPPLRVGPSDETIYVPPRRPSAAADETVFRRPAPVIQPEPVVTRPAPVEPPAFIPPPPAAAHEIEEEIPDWLQTPIPYVPSRTRPPAPAPVFAEASPPPIIETPAPAPEPTPALVEPPAAPVFVAPPPPVATPPMAAAPVETPAPTPVAAPPPAPEPAPPPAPPRREERRVEAVPPAMPPVIPAAKPPARVPRSGRGGADPAVILEAARKALATGDYQKAASSYASLIKRNIEVTSITEELRLALDRNPRTPSLWQTLGDAYMRGDRLEEAIEAYRRGMEAA